MSTRILWSRSLVIVGSIAMLSGALDPLEGSIVILAGSALVVLGTYLSKSQRKILLYWVWTFILITFGFSMMWLLTAFGGIGGSTGRSRWWGLVVLPYPIGWIMGMTSLIVRLVKFIRARKLSAH
ncbi:MAG: hypothetical protein EOM68_25760 [Spirochaetia bacterium]|nr:hypothetical protein [Spirochaetia bacterium]